MKKKIIWISICIVVVAAAVVGYLQFKGGKEAGIEVKTDPVERMTIVEAVTATGRIQPKTQVNISADVSAKITKLEVEEGQWVDKGQLLLELDREKYVATVESSEANLRVAESNARIAQENMAKAEKDYHRIKELFERELETQAQLDAAQASYQAEKARRQSALDQVEQARAALKQTRDDLSKTRIYAPMSGTVSELNKEEGEIALGSQFQEDVIMVLSNLAGMEALVDVDENDIVSVAVGDAATIEVDALPDVELKGQVTDIASSAKVSGEGTTDQKTEFEVKVAVLDANPDLKPGMTCSCDIVTDTHENALGVPIQCVAVRTPEQLGDAENEDLASAQRDTDGDVPGGGESAGEGAADVGATVDEGTADVGATADGGGVGVEDGGPESAGWIPDKDGFVEIVWVVENGKARARQVTTGIQSETHIEITDGLAEGDAVVTGSFRAISRDLRQGSDVRVTPDEGKSGGKKQGTDPARGASDDS